MNWFYRWLGDVTYKASRSQYVEMYSPTYYFIVAICQWAGVQANKPYMRQLQKSGEVYHYHADGTRCNRWDRKHLRKMKRENDYENI